MSLRSSQCPSQHADTAKSAWEGVRKQLEDERYRIAGEIGKYPTPIPACDQDFNHMLAERERISDELIRMEEVEKRSLAADDPFALIEEFIRSSSYLKNW